MLANKHKYLFFTLIFLLVLSLVGCNEKEVTQANVTEKNNNIEIVKLGEKTVIGATVSKVGEKTADIENPPSVSYKQNNSIELQTFVNAFQKAEKVGGVVKIRNPDFHLTLTFEDNTTSEYSLWIDNDRGSIMNEIDSHTLYTIPSDIIVVLNKYVK